MKYHWDELWFSKQTITIAVSTTPVFSCEMAMVSYFFLSHSIKSFSQMQHFVAFSKLICRPLSLPLVSVQMTKLAQYRSEVCLQESVQCFHLLFV